MILSIKSKTLADRLVEQINACEISLNNEEQVVYMISAKGYLDYLDAKRAK